MKYLLLLFTILTTTTVWAQPYHLDVQGHSRISGRIEVGVVSGSVFIGQNAGINDNTTAGTNTFVGRSAGQNNSTGVSNTFVGEDAGANNTFGQGNVYVGENAGKASASSDFNTFLGTNAGQNTNSGNRNTFVGQDAGNGNTLGDFNTFMGENAGQSNTNGDLNTFIGRNAGTNSITGTNNTALGADVSYMTSGLTNATGVGYGVVVDASNKVVVGNAAATTVGGYGAWTNYSAAAASTVTKVRNKVKGLEFIRALRPVTYQIDAVQLARQQYGAGADTMVTGNFLTALKAQSNIQQSGFLPIEVATAAAEVNYDFDGITTTIDKQNTKHGIRYALFTVPLVKAVQELDTENEELRAQNQALQTQLQQLQQSVAMIQQQLAGATTDLAVPTPTEQPAPATVAFLGNSQPNPANATVQIAVHIPPTIQEAILQLTDSQGKIWTNQSLPAATDDKINVAVGTYPAGTYFYTLYLDGKPVATRTLIVQH